MVHLAGRQRSGQGRHGRLWSSPPGNLYATIAWTAEERLPPAVLSAIQVAWCEAVAARNPKRLPVELEVRSLDELEEALASEHPPERLLLDNFPVPALAAAVARARAGAPSILLEASGGVTLDSVRAIAETGVDWISVGALTHSAPALDLSCLIARA